MSVPEPGAGPARRIHPAAWRFIFWLFVAGLGFGWLKRGLEEVRRENAALSARLDLSECGRSAVEAIRADLEGALVTWQDDDAGRAWLSRCAFPVDGAPAGGTSLPDHDVASVLLLARPAPAFVPDPGVPDPVRIPLVRIVAWYPAESTEAPALLSWESEPLADARALGALEPGARRDAAEALARAGIELAWSPGSPGPRAVHSISGDLAPVDDPVRPIRGTIRRWCGNTPGAPVLSRSAKAPAFAVEFSGAPPARRADIRLRLVGGRASAVEGLLQEFAAVATRLGN